MKGRIKYLDLLKFCAMLMVVFCHYVTIDNESILGNILMTLCWSCVPLFFMCSGAIMLNREFVYENWQRKLIMTYLACVVWKLLYMGMAAAMGLFDIGNENPVELFNYVFALCDLQSVPSQHLWFMRAYIGILLLYPLLHRLMYGSRERKTSASDGKYLGLLLAVLFVSTFVIFDGNMVIEWLAADRKTALAQMVPYTVFGEFTGWLFFFMTGGLLHRKYMERQQSAADKESGQGGYIARKRKGTVCLNLTGIALSVFVLMCIKFVYVGSFAWKNTYIYGGYTHIAVAVMSICIFVLARDFCRTDRQSRLIQYVACNTMGIYYLHMIMVYGLYCYCSPFITWNGLAVNIIKTVLVTAVACFLCMIMKKVPVLRRLVS